MSDAKKLNQAQAVTSLESTDSVLVTSANGELKRISRLNLRNQNRVQTRLVTKGDTQWLRILTMPAGMSFVGVMSITKSWNTLRPASLILNCAIHPNGAPKLEIVSRIAYESTTFDKVRFVYKKDSESYLDVHLSISGSTLENITATVLSGSYYVAIAATSGATVPEEYSSVEFTATNRGGIKHCFTTTWKGGVRHERKGFDQCDCERGLHGCDGKAWGLQGLRPMSAKRIVRGSDRDTNSKLSIRMLQVWSTCGSADNQLRRAKVLSSPSQRGSKWKQIHLLCEDLVQGQLFSLEGVHPGLARKGVAA